MSGSDDQSRTGNEVQPVWTDDGHVDEATIHTWLDDAFDDAAAEQVRVHVVVCTACQQEVAVARGFIAGASRVTRMLDAVPARVVPTLDVTRAAARIVAAANTRPTVARASRRWSGTPIARAAAVMLVSVGGALVWANNRTPSVAEFAAPARDTSVEQPLGARPVAPSSAPADSVITAASQSPSQSTTESTKNLTGKLAVPSAVSRAAPASQKASDAQLSTTERAKVSNFTALATRGAAADSSRTGGRTMGGLGRAAVVAGGAARGVAGGIARGVVSGAASGNVANAAAAVADRARSETVVQERLVRRDANDASRHMVVGRTTAENGLPLAMVQVTLAHDGSVGTVSDSLGHFALVVRMDSVDILARRIGYTPVRQSLSLAGRDSVFTTMQLTRSNVTQSEAAVASPAPLAASDFTCVAFRASGTAVPTTIPPRMRVRAHTSRNAERVAWTLWLRPSDDANAAPVPTTVMMSMNARGQYAGTVAQGGQLLQFALQPIGAEWTGTLTVGEGSRRSPYPLRYDPVDSTMCKF